MSAGQPVAEDRRVLLLLPTARDSALTRDILRRNGLPAHACGDAVDLARELARGVGVVMVAEETLDGGAHAVLAATIASQAPWEDLPVLVLTRVGADSLAVGDAVAALGNVTLLERPLRVAALVSTVRTALRARARQYQIQGHLAELEQARDAEAEAARRKDEFLAMLAHELRNPLAPIRNALNILALEDEDPARRGQLHATMMRQVEHLVRLVDDLLETSRISRGKITLRREHVDLRDVVRSALELSRPLVEGTGARVDVDLGRQPLPLLADPTRLVQVFGNLLNNAGKYGRAGGRIAVRAWRDGGEAVASVTDDGIGIEPQVLPHVFDLFVQGRRDQHRLHDGLGIGLALVRSLVQLHGGRASAHSDGQGRGARFEVRLPLRASALVAAEAPRTAAPRQSLPDRADGACEAPAAPAEGGRAGEDRMRVLVVDDNVDAADTLGLIVDMLGMDHCVAHDGQAALEAATRFRPDVVLMDIGMPGMDGYTLARRLRSDPLHAGTVLIAVTGWGKDEDRQRASDAGFDAHFRKPVDIARLSEVLDAVRGQRLTRSDGGAAPAATADDGSDPAQASPPQPRGLPAAQ